MTLHSTAQIELWQQLRQTPQLLEVIQQASGNELHLQNKLRKEYPAELVRLALELHSARRDAEKKFFKASQLWLTRTSYEQSTSEALAVFKAKRFASEDAGEEILDLCTGMGSDAIALARSHRVQAHDTSAVMLQLAEWNAEMYGVREAMTFHQRDVNEIDVDQKLIHVDPDQRGPSGRRSLRLEQIQPNLEKLQQMSAACRGGVIKLSPASNFGGKFPDCETELVSLNGECKAAHIWCGELGEPGLWRATVLPTEETICGDPLAAWPEFSHVQEYIFDPDPAVVRAGLVNILAEETEVNRLDDAEEYLTAAQQVESSFMSCFSVRDVLSRNEKLLKKYLREHEIGQVEIKCRHIPLNVEKIRRSFSLQGKNSATLIYARVAGKTKVIIADRCVNSEQKKQPS